MSSGNPTPRDPPPVGLSLQGTGVVPGSDFVPFYVYGFSADLGPYVHDTPTLDPFPSRTPTLRGLGGGTLRSGSVHTTTVEGKRDDRGIQTRVPERQVARGHKDTAGKGPDGPLRPPRRESGPRPSLRTLHRLRGSQRLRQPRVTGPVGRGLRPPPCPGGERKRVGGGSEPHHPSLPVCGSLPIPIKRVSTVGTTTGVRL